jgi:hypothetical protein
MILRITDVDADCSYAVCHYAERRDTSINNLVWLAYAGLTHELRLGWKNLQRQNALAYYQITKIHIQTFFFLMQISKHFHLANKLVRLSLPSLFRLV